MLGSISLPVTVGLYRGIHARIAGLTDYAEAERLALDAVRATVELAVIRDARGIMVAAFDCEGRSWRRDSDLPAATVAGWGRDFLDRHQIERAASAVEYALLLALVAIAAFLAIRLLGQDTSNAFSTVAGSLSS